MSQPNEEGRVQNNPPLVPRSGFTPDRPCAAVRPRGWLRWLTAGSILFAVLAIAVLITAYKADFFKYGPWDYPTTPMTVTKADQMASGGPPPGSSLEEVEAWLPSQGVTSNSRAPGPYYYFQRRSENDASAKRWMHSGEGGRSPAEYAGLKEGEVYSYIGVTYPDADRGFIFRDIITIYFFFDAKDRLIKHYVDLFRLMP
jgi:hypothetical protein